MSGKLNNVSSKQSCEHFTKQSRIATTPCVKTKPTTSKRVVYSKKLTANGNKNCKSSSADLFSNYKKPPVVKPKKTTKSEACFTPKVVEKRTLLDYCKECGDVIGPVQCNVINDDVTTTNRRPTETNDSALPKPSKNTVKSVENVKLYFKKGGKPEYVQQYYKNENFRPASDSTHEMEDIPKRITSLDTIKEVPEVPAPTEDSDDAIFRIYTDSESDQTDYLNPENENTIKKLKEFRNDNYFECHSARSRIKTKGSVTNLPNHKCVYRFYLNDRLFPVPLHTDHCNEIRCVECHLPLKLEKPTSNNSINGTVQAKVKIGSGEDAQDMLLMLPVKQQLIIKERRKEKADKNDKDVVYFGVIKLSANGNSVFNSNLPNDSLALKYQKGYKEFETDDSFKYERIEKSDVIII